MNEAYALAYVRQWGGTKSVKHISEDLKIPTKEVKKLFSEVIKTPLGKVSGKSQKHEEYKLWNTKEDALVLGGTLSNKQCAATLKRTEHSVSSHKRKLLCEKNKFELLQRMSTEEQEKMIALRKEKLSYRAIASEMKKDIYEVTAVLKAMGFERLR